MPINWHEFEIKEATQAQFNAIPAPLRGRRPDPTITAILDAVATGSLREIAVPDAAQIDDVRAALNRGAAKRGFKLDYRLDGRRLIIGRGEDAARRRQSSPSAPPGTKRGRGRPRKDEQLGLDTPQALATDAVAAEL